MNSPYHFVNNYQTKDTPNSLNLNNNSNGNGENPMFNQIEGLIQNQFNITTPALVFEYKPSLNEYNSDFTGWDHDDLVEFFSHFGEINSLQVFGKTAVILFNSFIDAYTSREFLTNSSNFKESEKDNFKVRWFTPQDEDSVTEPIRSKLKKYFKTQQIDKTSIINKLSQNNCTSNGFNDYYPKTMSNTQSSFSSSSNSFNNSGSQFNNSATSSINHSFNSNNKQSMFSKGTSSDNNEDQDTLQNGKYTCKFEIQIENDAEFQVARRLIGAKGYNMKKIVELCSKDNNGNFLNDSVKLRLRGRGSGYKEGPYNKGN